MAWYCVMPEPRLVDARAASSTTAEKGPVAAGQKPGASRSVQFLLLEFAKAAGSRCMNAYYPVKPLKLMSTGLSLSYQSVPCQWILY